MGHTKLNPRFCWTLRFHTCPAVATLPWQSKVTHSSVVHQMWFPSQLSTSWDWGYPKNKFEMHFSQIPGQILKLWFIEVLECSSKKYMIERLIATFHPIFEKFGTFYELCYPIWCLNIPFNGQKIEPKLEILMCLKKWRIWALKVIITQIK